MGRRLCRNSNLAVGVIESRKMPGRKILSPGNSDPIFLPHIFLLSFEFLGIIWFLFSCPAFSCLSF
jgi:hypothetical protein